MCCLSHCSTIARHTYTAAIYIIVLDDPLPSPAGALPCGFER